MSVNVSIMGRGVVTVKSVGTGLIGNGDTVSFKIHTGGDAYPDSVDVIEWDNGQVPLLVLSPRKSGGDNFTEVVFPDYVGWEVTSVRGTVNRNRTVLVTLNRIGAMEEAEVSESSGSDDGGSGGLGTSSYVPDIPIDPEYRKPSREAPRWKGKRDKRDDWGHEGDDGGSGGRGRRVVQKVIAWLLGGNTKATFALA